MARFVSLSLLFTLTACSSTTTVDGGTDAGADSGHDAGIDSGADAGFDAGSDAGFDAGSDSGPDAGTDSGSDSGTDAATGSGTLTITGFTAYANCMPSVPPDPILAFWTANITGAAGSTATLVDATLTITGSRTVVQHLTLDVPDVALTGGAGTADQRKTGADVNPGAACSDFCGGGVTVALDLTFMTADGVLTAHVEDTFGCVF